MFCLRQGVYELYKLMGNNDLLGNPLGLLSGVASGVFDFFYEPGSALFGKDAGVGEFGKGLARGTMSLMAGGPSRPFRVSVCASFLS